MEIELDNLLKLRGDLNERSKDGDHRISVNDMIIKASALALRQAPECNTTWDEEAIVFYDDVDISIAVSTPAGLITPIVRNADHKGLAQISKEMRDLGARAKSNALKPEEFQGGASPFPTSACSEEGVRSHRQSAANRDPGVSSGEPRPSSRTARLPSPP